MKKISVIVPKEGDMETCVIISWNCNAGDRVSMGDALCTVETDKASMDIMAPCNGVVAEKLHEEGEEIPVLSPVAVLEYEE